MPQVSLLLRDLGYKHYSNIVFGNGCPALAVSEMPALRTLTSHPAHSMIAIMEEQPQLSSRTKDLPRWVQILAGVILGLFTLLCALASLALLFTPNKRLPLLAIPAVLLLVLGCVWVLAKCFRLITGRKTRGGLMSPLALRTVSYFLLILPIGGFFTGYFREEGALAIFQAVAYFFGFLGLQSLARKRAAERTQQKEPKNSLG